MVKKMGPRQREIAPNIRGSQDAGSRNLGAAFLTITVQTGDMKRRPGNGIEGTMVCTNLGSLLRPLFYFLDDIPYPQSV